MMIYICTKFHENILNSIRVMERPRKVNGRTDGHDIIRPVLDGRTKKIAFRFCCNIDESDDVATISNTRDS